MKMGPQVNWWSSVGPYSQSSRARSELLRGAACAARTALQTTRYPLEINRQPPQAFLDRDVRLVPEIASCRAEVEPVRRRQFAGEKARHGWFFLAAQQTPDAFQGPAGQAGRPDGNGPRHRRKPS